MQREIIGLDKGSIGSQVSRVDFLPGTVNDGQGKMRIHLCRAQARIVLGTSDLSGLLHGLEIGARKGRYLLGRTTKGAPHLVGSVDYGHVNNRSDIDIDPQG